MTNSKKEYLNDARTIFYEFGLNPLIEMKMKLRYENNTLVATLPCRVKCDKIYKINSNVC